jgi:hypothetical protein
MDATFKKRMFKVAKIHFVLSVVCSVLSVFLYFRVFGSQYIPSETEKIGRVMSVCLWATMCLQPLIFFAHKINSLQFLVPSGWYFLILCPLWSLFIGSLVAGYFRLKEKLS